MQGTGKGAYSIEEFKRHKAVFDRLNAAVNSPAPDPVGFWRLLNEALAEGFPINFPGGIDGWTLLHRAVVSSPAVRAGLPELLIEAGADINALAEKGGTPLSEACWNYAQSGVPEYLTVIDLLLALGARPGLNESWVDDGWLEPEEQERARRLDAYIKTWQARSRAKDAAPAFDYAL